jgi:hypothetical protein
VPEYGYRWARLPKLHKSISGNIRGGTNWKVSLYIYLQILYYSIKYKHLLLRGDTSTTSANSTMMKLIAFDSWWNELPLILTAFPTVLSSRLRVPHLGQHHINNPMHSKVHGSSVPNKCLFSDTCTHAHTHSEHWAEITLHQHPLACSITCNGTCWTSIKLFKKPHTHTHTSYTSTLPKGLCGL